MQALVKGSKNLYLGWHFLHLL